MKQNIVVAIDRALLKRVEALAAQRGTSISGLLAVELRRLVEHDEAYERAKVKALAYLTSPFHLGGVGIRNREALHDRQGLR